LCDHHAVDADPFGDTPCPATAIFRPPTPAAARSCAQIWEGRPMLVAAAGSASGFTPQCAGSQDLHRSAGRGGSGVNGSPMRPVWEAGFAAQRRIPRSWACLQRDHPHDGPYQSQRPRGRTKVPVTHLTGTPPAGQQSNRMENYPLSGHQVRWRVQAAHARRTTPQPARGHRGAVGSVKPRSSGARQMFLART